MAPPVQDFPASAIPKHVPRGLDTSTCPLKQLVQFECILDHDDTPICFPVTRRFRAYVSLNMRGTDVVVPWMEGLY
jgi:hypothetical protein